jgi:hypothetical protein
MFLVAGRKRVARRRYGVDPDLAAAQIPDSGFGLLLSPALRVMHAFRLFGAGCGPFIILSAGRGRCRTSWRPGYDRQGGG